MAQIHRGVSPDSQPPVSGLVVSLTRQDSNVEPAAFQTAALPIELQAKGELSGDSGLFGNPEWLGLPSTGFEPALPQWGHSPPQPAGDRTRTEVTAAF